MEDNQTGKPPSSFFDAMLGIRWYALQFLLSDVFIKLGGSRNDEQFSEPPGDSTKSGLLKGFLRGALQIPISYQMLLARHSLMFIAAFRFACIPVSGKYPYFDSGKDIRRRHQEQYN